MALPREKLTSEELAMVLSHYDLGIVRAIADFPRGSHAAPKVVIRTDRGKFLLKRRQPDKNDPYRVAFAHALQQYLAEESFPLPHLVGTRERNNSMLKIGGAVYEVFEFIEGGPYDRGLVPTYESGKMLGLYHRLVKDYEPKWEPPHGHYHASSAVLHAFPQVGSVLADADSVRGRREELVDTLKQLRRAYKEAARTVEALGIREWEDQIVHSDWHPGNMLFDNGRVVAILDYDAARIQPRVIDLANGALQFSTITAGRDLSAWDDRTDALRAQRFLRGYDELNVITEAELKTVPYLMQEALISQALFPIIRTGTFAGLDGFGFLQVVLRKVRWLRDHADRFTLIEAE